MPEFRLYRIADDGHLAGPGIEFEADDDRTALKEARKYVDVLDVQLWQGQRVIGYLVPDKRPQAAEAEFLKAIS